MAIENNARVRPAGAYPILQPQVMRQASYSPDVYVGNRAPVAAQAQPGIFQLVGNALKALWNALKSLFSGPSTVVAPVGRPPVSQPPVSQPPVGLPPVPPPPPVAPPPPPPPVAPPPPPPPGQSVPVGAENASMKDKKVFVHYMPWFDTAKHWNLKGHDLTKTNAQGLPDIAAVHHPVIGAYNQLDDAVLGYHMLLQKAAGFDGAVINWYGHGSGTDTVTRSMFKKADEWAKKYGFDYAIQLMPDAGPYENLSQPARVQKLAADLNAILDEYASSPRYQRVNGTPPIYFFPKPAPDRPGQEVITPEDWAQVRQLVGRPFDLVMENEPTNYGNQVQGAYGWVHPKDDHGSYAPEYLQWLYKEYGNDMAKDPNAIRLGVTYAGFNDSGVWAWTNDPNAKRVMDRTTNGKATVQNTWDELNAYNRAHPATPINWVQAVTWNDWNEGTELEPSVEEGDAELKLMGQNIAQFKGQQAAPQPAYAFAYRYYQLRKAGKSDDDLGPAIAAFSRGAYDQALAMLA